MRDAAIRWRCQSTRLHRRAGHPEPLRSPRHTPDVSTRRVDAVPTTGSSGGFLLIFWPASTSAIAWRSRVLATSALPQHPLRAGCEVVEIPCGPETRFQPTPVSMLDALDLPVAGVIVASSGQPDRNRHPTRGTRAIATWCKAGPQRRPASSATRCITAWSTTAHPRPAARGKPHEDAVVVNSFSEVLRDDRLAARLAVLVLRGCAAQPTASPATSPSARPQWPSTRPSRHSRRSPSPKPTAAGALCRQPAPAALTSYRARIDRSHRRTALFLRVRRCQRSPRIHFVVLLEAVGRHRGCGSHRASTSIRSGAVSLSAVLLPPDQRRRRGRPAIVWGPCWADAVTAARRTAPTRLAGHPQDSDLRPTGPEPLRATPNPSDCGPPDRRGGSDARQVRESRRPWKPVPYRHCAGRGSACSGLLAMVCPPTERTRRRCRHLGPATNEFTSVCGFVAERAGPQPPRRH